MRRPKICLPPVGPLLYSSCKVIAIANLPVARCSRFSSCMVLSSCMVVASVRVAQCSRFFKLHCACDSSSWHGAIEKHGAQDSSFCPEFCLQWFSIQCSARDSSICPVLCSWFFHLPRALLRFGIQCMEQIVKGMSLWPHAVKVATGNCCTVRNFLADFAVCT